MFGNKKKTSIFDSKEFRAGFNNGAGQAAGGAGVGVLLAAVTAGAVACAAWLESSSQQAEQPEGGEALADSAQTDVAPVPC